jgi:hypothetical protein
LRQQELRASNRDGAVHHFETISERHSPPHSADFALVCLRHEARYGAGVAIRPDQALVAQPHLVLVGVDTHGGVGQVNRPPTVRHF